MAEDEHNTSDISDPADPEPAKEDAETSAARRELKQTSISENLMPLPSSAEEEEATQEATQAHSQDHDEGHAAADEAAKTPEENPAGAISESLREEISSPKKKRAHDQVDEPREAANEPDTEKGSTTTANGDRSDRLEPEKKRARDQKLEEASAGSRDTEAASQPKSLTGTATDNPSFSFGSAPSPGREKRGDTTSSSAFAKSGFAKLAASTSSPFGALGGPAKSNLFGGGSAPSSASPSPFGALAGAPSVFASTASPPKLDISSPAASGSASPFASLNGPSKTFGSAFGGGFGSTLGAPRLTNFGKPGDALPKSEKPAKPFGAPDSDAEDGSEAEGEEEEENGDGEEDEREENDKDKDADKEDAKSTSDEKKKTRLQKVFVDDGEAGEVTILQVRAKMFQLEDKETGWKERGAGMLKINAPESCVSFDDSGVPVPGSFDASGLEEEEDDDDEEKGEGDTSKGRKVVRLIMRQDHTLRVILNTPIVGATSFQERAALKATNILFTAFEEGEGRPVQMKMTHANAQAFLNEVENIKRELQNS